MSTVALSMLPSSTYRSPAGGQREEDPIRFHDLMSSRLATRTGLFIGRHLPPRIAYGLARIVANYASRKRPGNYWKVAANLRQVVGPEVDDAALHEMVRQVFFHAGQVYYDFYHSTRLTPDELAHAAWVPPEMIDLLKTQVERGGGAVVLGLHMSGFDLGMIAIGAQGVPIQVLTLADPGPGFELQNHIRARAGIDVTPISPESLRLAIRRLKSGWTVFTGADRPVQGEQGLVEFFGRPAYLPLGPVRMALMTGAAVVVASCCYDRATGYAVRFTGPIEMVRTGDRDQDILANARRTAIAIEEHIRAHPQQWLMFHHVWPENLPETAEG
jgi:KDO2-lipid IV(A) lauroyltransferase